MEKDYKYYKPIDQMEKWVNENPSFNRPSPAWWTYIVRLFAQLEEENEVLREILRAREWQDAEIDERVALLTKDE